MIPVLLSSGHSTIIVAVGASTLVPALILLQLFLTDARVLLSPARVAKLLETVASALGVVSLIRGGAQIHSLVPPFSAYLFVALLVGDLFLFVFLMAYTTPPRPTSSDTLPHTTIETVEER
jgi:hypothetical protein